MFSAQLCRKKHRLERNVLLLFKMRTFPLTQNSLKKSYKKDPRTFPGKRNFSFCGRIDYLDFGNFENMLEKILFYSCWRGE